MKESEQLYFHITLYQKDWLANSFLDQLRFSHVHKRKCFILNCALGRMKKGKTVYSLKKFYRHGKCLDTSGSCPFDHRYRNKEGKTVLRQRCTSPPPYTLLMDWTNGIGIPTSACCIGFPMQNQCSSEIMLIMIQLRFSNGIKLKILSESQISSFQISFGRCCHHMFTI